MKRGYIKPTSRIIFLTTADELLTVSETTGTIVDGDFEAGARGNGIWLEDDDTETEW